MDPDLEDLPTDYTGGVDFRLSKGSKGGYADYGASNWARRTRPLSDAEMKAINDNGLFNLSDFLPKKPNEVELKVLTEMFEASVDGEPYDPDRWSQYFRPAGLAAKTGDPMNSSASSASSASKASRDDDIPFEDEPAPAPVKMEAPKPEAAMPSASGAQDILAKIRARQNQG
jgi:hypothetical protein